MDKKEEEELKSLASSSLRTMAFLLSSLPFPSPSSVHVILPQLLLFISSSDSNQGRKRKLSQREDEEEAIEDERRSELTTMLSGKACPDQFRTFFMMTSSTFQYLSGLLDPLLDCQQPPSLSSSSSTSRLAIALHRLATGCSYEEIARRFGVTTSTAQFWTKRLCRVLCTNFRFWFSFPSSPSSFSVDGYLPNCCGAIVSTRFKIADGSRVLTQIVSGPNSKILNLSVGHRGLKSSSIFQSMTGGENKGRYLVGGIGYPLLPWLMVPFTTPNSKEMQFNKVHREMLRPAQRALRWVRSWGLLRGGVVDEGKKMAVACIATCSILNNVMLMREDHSVVSLSDDDDHDEIYTEEEDDDDDDDEEEEEENGMVDDGKEEGFDVRMSLAENIYHQTLPTL